MTEDEAKRLKDIEWQLTSARLRIAALRWHIEYGDYSPCPEACDYCTVGTR